MTFRERLNECHELGFVQWVTPTDPALKCHSVIRRSFTGAGEEIRDIEVYLWAATVTTGSWMRQMGGVAISS